MGSGWVSGGFQVGSWWVLGGFRIDSSWVLVGQKYVGDQNSQEGSTFVVWPKNPAEGARKKPPYNINLGEGGFHLTL